ncbi:MAG: TonB-dependent receptor plug domain-containing protein [Bacteroidota bacterium]|jgi:outer membrane receptor for ferrienterochelin and colicins
MKKILLIILSGCLPLLSFGQIKTCDATLYMVNASNDTLPFSYAFVILVNGQNTEGEFQTDQNGKFQFQFDPSLDYKLFVSTNKDLLISIHLKNQTTCNFYVPFNFGTVNLSEVDIVKKRDATEMSLMKTRGAEVLNEGELLKAACCNLSESFETNPSVDVNYGDAVTGVKEIQLLGLSGLYTQMLGDVVPTLRGLAVPFGLNYVPGPWLESIQISKGAGSVANGYEAITGQINLSFKKPSCEKSLFLNGFSDTEGRNELNVIADIPISENLKYILMAHSSFRLAAPDRNDDGFIDQPKLQLFNVYNHLDFRKGNKFEGQIILKALSEIRSGGQKAFDETTDLQTFNHYGFQVKTNRIEGIIKSGWMFPEKPWKTIGIQVSNTIHNHQSYFGKRILNANQYSGYFNLSYLNIIGITQHKYKIGLDYKTDIWNQQIDGIENNRTENVPGAYAEYSYESAKENFGLIAGVRADHHSLFGFFITPRLNIRYNVNEQSVVRFSVGEGRRSPNYLTDNLSVMLNSKQLILLEKLNMENAWNGGFNYTLKKEHSNGRYTIATDVYYTYFLNQIVADQYSSNEAIYYYNLRGESSALSSQITISNVLNNNVEFKLAGKYDYVISDYLAIKQVQKPLVAPYKLLGNIGYTTDNEIWRFDATLQWESAKLLPSKTGIISNEINIEKSPSIFLLQAQITKQFRKWELYVGGENLLNTMQDNPIVSANNPFSNEFDATRIYGPVMGAKAYVGFRMKIEK